MIVRMQLKDIEGFEVGQQLSLTEMFKEGDFIDVAGKSVGKGFQGMSCLLAIRGIHQSSRSSRYVAENLWLMT